MTYGIVNMDTGEIKKEYDKDEGLRITIEKERKARRDYYARQEFIKSKNPFFLYYMNMTNLLVIKDYLMVTLQEQ